MLTPLCPIATNINLNTPFTLAKSKNITYGGGTESVAVGTLPATGTKVGEPTTGLEMIGVGGVSGAGGVGGGLVVDGFTGAG